MVKGLAVPTSLSLLWKIINNDGLVNNDSMAGVMHPGDSQILSTPDPITPMQAKGQSADQARPTFAPESLMFDACQVGVVLRAVLLVQAAAAVVTMFGVDSMRDWLAQLSLLTSACLPATLIWLIVACSLKSWLARLTTVWQQFAGVLLGALLGFAAAAVLWRLGLVEVAHYWAGAFAGALLAGVLVTLLLLRAKGTMPAATAARLADLQSRIQPHFLFNTLNSAIALVREQPRQAEQLLEDLSDLFRYALSDQGQSASLATEITLAKRYLAIEKMRFGDRLRVDWVLDDKANNARLPPMLLQPLLENAVKHGVAPSADGAQIWIRTRHRGEVVVIEVSNTVATAALHDGQPSGGHGLALNNVRERLALLHDLQGQFQSGLRNGRFEVRIEVPA